MTTAGGSRTVGRGCKQHAHPQRHHIRIAVGLRGPIPGVVFPAPRGACSTAALDGRPGALTAFRDRTAGWHTPPMRPAGLSSYLGAVTVSRSDTP